MKKFIVAGGLAGFSLLLLAVRDVNPDELAWDVLTEISHAHAGVVAGETPVGWRRWPTPGEVYPPAGSLTPASTGEYDTARPLPCERNIQQLVDTPAGPPTCMAVFLNPAATRYILDRKLFLRQNLADAAAGEPGIRLPREGAVAREIKTAWRPIAPTEAANFVVAIDGKSQTWGLAALHLMTHERPRWLWATWIHEKYATSVPQEIGLQDSFGVAADGRISADLARQIAARNVPFLAHYRLIGTQTEFKPAALGNPLIEGANLKCSSCMGCHQFAALRKDGSWSSPAACDMMRDTGLPAGMHATDFDYSLASHAKCHGVGGCKDAL